MGESKHISWEIKENVPLTQEELDMSNRKQFFIYGSFNTYSMPVRMQYTGEYYQAFVELGDTAELLFFLTEGPDLKFKIFPDVEDANPGTDHRVFGYTEEWTGAQWKIGTDFDEPEPYKRYEVKAFANDNGMVTKVA